MRAPTASVAVDADPPRILERGLLNEAQRQFDICNACRYCEGLCAVFPALERRPVFSEGDVLYLANLCHDCRSCYDVCPYATPHEFAVDIPPLMSRIREETYKSYARPRALGDILLGPTRGRAWLALFVVAVTVAIGLLILGWDRLVAPPAEEEAFYEVIPFLVMTIPASVISGLALLFLGAGVVAFWRDTTGGRPDVGSIKEAVYAAFSLRNMHGGGPGCTYPQEAPEKSRLVMHSLVFNGFLATFVATILAAIWQELLGRMPPYPLLSAPVIIGTVGGIATIAGCIGLVVLRIRSREELGTAGVRRLDLDFIILLVLVNLSGLALLALRSTTAMGLLLLVHLALVAAFFVSLPYGKFVHATYRTSALIQDSLEDRAEAASA
ncbi:MAG: tricarballylate utilization 4Fe-4S protein TcuB [Acidimicrobiia bacterium]|nr:tricarballylate utilization 4Fe-4S protein TcuB [Acidimicrobiia bacterium]